MKLQKIEAGKLLQMMGSGQTRRRGSKAERASKEDVGLRNAG
ncbi:hypothetical protein HDG34_005433 [Paraburkholderia sp. HC6.4b]|nr:MULTISPECIES: hypothetical protein [unclassified Paraburkholderia]MBB5411472.1 hypothetical protein [Paraburkholderia sp. HC6.4b]MBB5450006.1 hypothetical protein [Paraburkholderia sp. Kb1A]MBB5497890.1 hypothetical protein [Paraburkholderia sp. MM5384-R2]